MNTDYLIKLEKFMLRRGKTMVLDVASMGIAAGRMLALIGPNGAGKTSLLLTLAGLLKHQSGALLFRGRPVESGADRMLLRRSTSVVFQESLLLNCSVYDNVALGLQLRGKSGEAVRTGVAQALQYFGISSLSRRPARTLSGGEAKRVSLARAFALKPQLILLDEPFNFLDPPTRETIIQDLQAILDETKITAVMALHDREETLRLAQDVAVLSEGKIIQFGTTAGVFNQPHNEFVAGFVGTESILPGIVRACTAGNLLITVAGESLEAVGDFVPGEKVYCCLRPESVTVAGEVAGKMSARNVFPAKVRKISRHGYFYKLLLDCGFPLISYITQTSIEELQLKEGAAVYASFKATALHIIRRE